MRAKGDRTGELPSLTSDRLASLSDTMFGVAMTLVATSLLPAIQSHHGSALTLLHDIKNELAAVVFSFGICGEYWVGQQRRLAQSHTVTEQQTVMHLLFLFLIVLVPITVSIPGVVGSDATLGPILLYGTHFSLIALVNLLLWIPVHRRVAAHAHLVRSALALVLFVVGLALGAVRPYLAQFIWLSVYAVPLIRGRVTAYIYPP